jgi:hypothetical protein
VLWAEGLSAVIELGGEVGDALGPVFRALGDHALEEEVELLGAVGPL